MKSASIYTRGQIVFIVYDGFITMGSVRENALPVRPATTEELQAKPGVTTIIEPRHYFLDSPPMPGLRAGTLCVPEDCVFGTFAAAKKSWAENRSHVEPLTPSLRLLCGSPYAECSFNI
jgi:hypothetical protein